MGRELIRDLVVGLALAAILVVVVFMTSGAAPQFVYAAF